MDIARNLGVSVNVLNRWIREHHADTQHAFPDNGKLKEPEEELRQLRKELADTKMERDILKKALTFFREKAPEISVYPGKPKGFPCHQDLPGTESQSKRSLQLAPSNSKPSDC